MLRFQLKQRVLTVSTSAMAPDVPPSGWWGGGHSLPQLSVGNTGRSVFSAFLK